MKSLTWRRYVRKWRGTRLPPAQHRLTGQEILLATVGSGLSLAAVAIVSQWVGHLSGVRLELASFGASAALLFSAPASPLSQPRNLVGGHLLSAVVGVFCYRLSQEISLLEARYVAEALAVALSVVAMHFTRTFHPPGGATALFAVIGGPSVYDLGFSYVLAPTLTSAVVLVVLGTALINLLPSRRYPIYWW